MAVNEDPHPASAADAISHMPTDHLQCRDFGHSWRPYTVDSVPQRREYRVTLACSRCKTLRVRIIDRQGRQLGSGYKYADGYLVHGIGRLDEDDRNGLRLASVFAMIEQISGTKPKATRSRRKRA